MKTPFSFWPSLATNRQGSRTTIVVLNPHLLKIFLVAIFTGCLNLLLPSSVHAQTLSLSLYPPILEAQLQPGQTIHQIYRLKNQGDTTTVTARLVPFEAADDLGHALPSLQNYQSPALGFFTLDSQALPLTFPLKAGEVKELSLTLTLPPSANLTDHYLTLLFEADTQGLITGSGSRTLGAIGSNILLTVASSNPPQPQAVIEAFSFNHSQFTLKVSNPTPAYLKAIGQITLTNSFNQSTTLPLRSDNVLAHSSRQLQLQTPWQPLFPFGRYTATLTLTPKNSLSSTSQTISFWIIPYKPLLILLLVFLIYRFFPLLSKYIKTHQLRLPKFLRF